FPVRMIESGPAAGALIAARYGALSGDTDLIAFDMGGTTAKLALVSGGRPQTGGTVEAHPVRPAPRRGAALDGPSPGPGGVLAGPGGDRRWRRFDRSPGAGDDPGRPGVGRLLSRTCLLRARWHRADRHRRQSAPRLPQPRQLRGRHDAPGRRGRATSRRG